MALELAMRVTADVAQANAGLTSTTHAVDTLTAEAKAASAQAAALGAALGQFAAATQAATRAAEAAAKAAAAQAAAHAAVRTSAEQSATAEQKVATATTATTAATDRARAAQERIARERAAAAAATAKLTAEEEARQRALAAATADEEARARAVAAATAQQAAAAETLRGRYVPLHAASRDYRAQLAEIRQAEKDGVLSSAQATAAIGRTKAAFAEHVVAARAAGKGLQEFSKTGKLAGWQAQQLSFQLNDVVVSLASGQNPLTVLVQQGSQIAPLFGGIKGTFQALVSVLTPARVAAGGVTAAVVAGAMAWSDYVGSMREVDIASRGLGASLGASSAELEAMARAGAAAGSVSVVSARAMEAAFLRTGTIGTRNFQGLIAIARDFGATLGTTTDEARDQLAKIFSDPAAGADILYRQLHLIDGATARYVQKLVEQNRGEEARTVLLATLQTRIAGAAEALGTLARFWDDVARGASDAWDATGRAIDGTVEKARAAMDVLGPILAARQMAAGGPDTASSIAGALGARVGAGVKAQNPFDQAFGTIIPNPGLRDKLIDSIGRADPRLAAARDTATSRAAGIAQGSSAASDAQRRRQLETDSNALRAGLAGGLLGDERADATAALDAKTRALQTWMDASQKAQALARIDMALATAQDPLTQAELTARRTAIELTGQEITTAQASVQIETARQRALAEGLATYQTRASSLQADIAAQRALNAAIASDATSRADAEQQMKVEQELRPLLIAYAKAEGAAKAELGRVIDGLRTAYGQLAAEERRGRALGMLASQDERLAQLRAETSLVGASTAARERALAALKAEQELRRQGIDLSSSEAARYRANAALEADLTVSLERQQDAYSTLHDFGASALDNLTQSIAQNGLSWETLRTTINSIVADLIQTFAKLAILNPIKNALFGTNLGTMADLFGGGRGANDNSRAANDNGAGLPGAVARSVTGAAATGTTAAGAQAAAWTATTGGLNPEFGRRLEAMISDASSSGLKIGITSGFRSTERQAQLWADAVAKYGSESAARKWVAPPGSSNHNRGLAADLSYSSADARSWAHDNAGRYGLSFPLDNEAWHVEPLGLRSAQGGGSAAEAVDALARSARDASSGLGTLGRGLSGSASSLLDSARGIGAAGDTLQTSATATTGEAQDAFGQLIGGLEQGVSQFVQAFGSGLQSILSSLSGSGESSSDSGGGILGIVLGGLGNLFGAKAGSTGGGDFALPHRKPSTQLAGGGRVTGAGSGTSDSIPAYLSDGEFVVRAAVASRHLPFLDALNAGRTGFAEGGPVGATRAFAVGANPAFQAAANDRVAGGGWGTYAPVTSITVGANAGVSKEEVRQIVDEGNRRTYERSMRDAPVVTQRARKATRGRST
ncbi:phage tail length tape measure family protein [Segnochrobactrum spirostomi]|uniref:Peptidase M15B domain-containing protein n=1 Tax=Segnochrobactrum spirostomi TaxID=2608987 RepID=A0A6A7Y6E4_9HYPH|nr:phage tail length tape measure family protein [Segnochrobactrum spirostomi]MQT13638.1 hypothetical protein [Segnochrobactrum spirostomi]